MQMKEQERVDNAKEFDRALFDFDEDIDNLEEVDDRYPINTDNPGDVAEKENKDKMK